MNANRMSTSVPRRGYFSRPALPGQYASTPRPAAPMSGDNSGGSVGRCQLPLSRGLCRTPDRHKTDLDPLIQRTRYPAQHRQGVALVLGVLKAADDRCGGAYELGKLSLGEG